MTQEQVLNRDSHLRGELLSIMETATSEENYLASWGQPPPSRVLIITEKATQYQKTTTSKQFSAPQDSQLRAEIPTAQGSSRSTALPSLIGTVTSEQLQTLGDTLTEMAQ